MSIGRKLVGDLLSFAQHARPICLLKSEGQSRREKNDHQPLDGLYHRRVDTDSTLHDSRAASQATEEGSGYNNEQWITAREQRSYNAVAALSWTDMLKQPEF